MSFSFPEFKHKCRACKACTEYISLIEEVLAAYLSEDELKELTKFRNDLYFGDIDYEKMRRDIMVRVVRLYNRNNGTYPSLGEIAKELKSRYPRSSVERVIKTMVESGLLVAIPSPPGQPGRPTVRYKTFS